MEEAFQAEGVRGILHEPEQPRGDGLLLTHGAGSNANAPLLVKVARAFADSGYFVLRYDLPFRQQKPGGSPHPSGAARDREGVRLAVAAMRQLAAGRVLAGGHSYGGRQTAMAAAEDSALADGLLLLSYPLHPPKRPDQMRTAFFPQLNTRALFVHGTHDPFASIEELRESIALIPARTELLPVEGAGHDLKRAGDLGADLTARLHALVCYPGE
jgi:predicted alpha/beta-hydrolase family hydrolase